MSGEKTRSLGQILEKPFVRSRSNIFVKLGQNVCLDKVLDEFENGSCRVTRSLGEILEKTLCTL